MAILKPSVGDGSIVATPTPTPGAAQDAWMNVDLDAAFAAAPDPVVGGAKTLQIQDITTNAVNKAAVFEDKPELNVAVGSGALNARVLGSAYYNNALGDSALQNVTIGSNNIGIGTLAGTGISSGNGNIAIGAQMPETGVTGNNNIAIGFEALDSMGAGSNNIGIGTAAGDFTATGDDNISIGDHSGAAAGLDGKQRNIVIGKNTGLSIASNSNVCIGPLADTPDGATDAQLNLANVLFGDASNLASPHARVGGSGAVVTQPETFRVHQSGPDSTPVLALRTAGTNGALITVWVGTRDPNGTVPANAGDLYIQKNAAASRIYINRSAADPGTSWSVVTAVP